MRVGRLTVFRLEYREVWEYVWEQGDTVTRRDKIGARRLFVPVVFVFVGGRRGSGYTG